VTSVASIFFGKQLLHTQSALSGVCGRRILKRAGFTLMATLAVHDKKVSDGIFEQFLPLIVREAEDPRNYVKKAVNWALRQIGKRNKALNGKAINTAHELRGSNSKTALWIASDAL
jgi:3-methyladenine DNA glycosylase AlkD